MKTENLLTLIQILLTIISLVLVLIQLNSIKRTNKADHERIKKQSTIETAGKDFRDTRFSLEEKYGRPKIIDEKTLNLIKNDKLELASLRKCFGIFEHISVGVNSCVYDEDIFFRMIGTDFIDIYNRFYPFIAYLRTISNSVAVYDEMEKLKMTFESKEEKHFNDTGRIPNL